MVASQAQPLIVFSHGNGFPASTYRVLLEALRSRGFAVEALEQFGHDPRFPVTSNWTHLVDELLAFVARVRERDAQPAFLVGHSLGGLLSLMAAAREPSWARGVVLLDSPIVGGWQAQVVRMAKKFAFAGRFSPGAVSQKRRFQWPSLDEVRQHFSSKRAFAAWDPEVLEDYVVHGTVAAPQGGERRALRFDRDIETAIYNSIPDHLPNYLRRHPLRCPVALIAGRESREMRLADLTFTERVIRGRKTVLEGTHLFPMEKPRVCAAFVEATLLSFDALNPRPVRALP